MWLLWMGTLRQCWNDTVQPYFIRNFLSPANTQTRWSKPQIPSCYTGNNTKKSRIHNKYTIHTRKLTQGHETRQQKKYKRLFKCTLVARCLHMINRHGNQAAGFFGILSVLRIGKQHCCYTGVKQLFQDVAQNQIQAKWISQVVATAAQSTAMEWCCVEVPVSGSVRPHGRACDCVGG